MDFSLSPLTGKLSPTATPHLPLLSSLLPHPASCSFHHPSPSSLPELQAVPPGHPTHICPWSCTPPFSPAPPHKATPGTSLSEGGGRVGKRCSCTECTFTRAQAQNVKSFLSLLPVSWFYGLQKYLCPPSTNPACTSLGECPPPAISFPPGGLHAMGVRHPGLPGPHVGTGGWPAGTATPWIPPCLSSQRERGRK